MEQYIVVEMLCGVWQGIVASHFGSRRSEWKKRGHPEKIRKCPKSKWRELGDRSTMPLPNLSPQQGGLKARIDRVRYWIHQGRYLILTAHEVEIIGFCSRKLSQVFYYVFSKQR